MAKISTVSLMIELDRSSTTPLYRQIADKIRRDIMSEKLQKRDRLPSIRALSAELHVGHVTVERAYKQLSMEGLVASEPKSGYRVSAVDAELHAQLPNSLKPSVQRSMQERHKGETGYAHASQNSLPYDFSYVNLQPGSFPLKAFQKIMHDMFATLDDSNLICYEDISQANHLQKQLAILLGKTRGVRCLPEQIVLETGANAGIGAILRLFNRDAHAIGVEEPGLTNVHETAELNGFRHYPIPGYLGDEAYFSELDRIGPKVVYSTPSHQFPTGRLMPLDFRMRLLEWAEEHNAYIIEDDHDNEYHYEDSSIPSLQSLDVNNRVVYVGSMSQALSPSLRIAYIVLPPKLLGRYNRMSNGPANVAWVMQETLARFIEQGYWGPHVRRMAHGNKLRRDKLMAALDREFGKRVDVSGTQSGHYVLVRVQNDMSAQELVSSARKHGVSVYATDHFWYSGAPASPEIMLGYSSIQVEDIAEGVRRLSRAWFPEGEA